MSTVVNIASRTAAVGKRGLLWLGVALLVALGLLGPRAVPFARVALWYVHGGPPLDFDAPHDGQVIAHIERARPPGVVPENMVEREYSHQPPPFAAGIGQAALLAAASG